MNQDTCSKKFHLNDSLTWTAKRTQEALKISGAWKDMKPKQERDAERKSVKDTIRFGPIKKCDDTFHKLIDFRKSDEGLDGKKSNTYSPKHRNRGKQQFMKWYDKYCDEAKRCNFFIGKSTNQPNNNSTEKQTLETIKNCHQEQTLDSPGIKPSHSFQKIEKGTFARLHRRSRIVKRISQSNDETNASNEDITVREDDEASISIHGLESSESTNDLTLSMQDFMSSLLNNTGSNDIHFTLKQDNARSHSFHYDKEDSSSSFVDATGANYKPNHEYRNVENCRNSCSNMIISRNSNDFISSSGSKNEACIISDIKKGRKVQSSICDTNIVSSYNTMDQITNPNHECNNKAKGEHCFAIIDE